MKTYPLQTVDLEKAKEMQFRLVDLIHRNFNGVEFLRGGDYGVVHGLGRPKYTAMVETVLAQFFGSEGAALVRGAGTGAIRNVLNSLLRPGDDILLHEAPVYPTTEATLESMGLNPTYLDFNNLSSRDDQTINKINFALIQHTRQKPDDNYDLSRVIKYLKRVNPGIFIMVDDNYAVMKADKIGIQAGADAGAFSMFKLLGPEGIGCVLADRRVIKKIRRLNYSGGSQVQGAEAMEALRSLVYAPVALAIQAEEGDKVLERLKQGEVKGVKSAFKANAQSNVILVEFEKPLAKQVLKNSVQLGAAPYPVGAESRYEVTALFYRVSGTFLKAHPELEDYMIRINPLRAGAETVIRILKAALSKALDEGGD